MKQNSKRLLSVKSFLTVIAVCGFGILYVFQHIVITKLGYQIRRDELRYDSLANEKEKLLSMISSMESPSNIQKMIADANLNLELSKNPKVVRVKM